MYDLTIDEVWIRMHQNERNEFHTVTGLPFTYKFISENVIKTNRTDYNLSKGNFEKMLGYMPVSNVSEVTRKIRGASYLFAILNDSRIKK